MPSERIVTIQIKARKSYYDQLRAKKGTNRTWEEFLMKEIFFIDIPPMSKNKDNTLIKKNSEYMDFND